ncbi:MAG: hypothetical protein RL220_2095 [Bacteroidota bacterium]|jgi:hypothetical protein
MLPGIPLHVYLVFGICAFFTVGAFIAACWNGNSDRLRNFTWFISLALLFWMIFQSILSVNGYFMDRKATPPHLAIPVMMFLGAIALVFSFRKTRKVLDHLSLEILTWLHIVRIPVELCLYWLFLEKQVPQSMTFEGMNFDIISGITAPVVAWAYFRKEVIGPKILLYWNIGALVLLLIVVIRGTGAVPSPIQSWDFEQPNYAMLHFPFSWLPTVIVPIVLMSHLIAIRRILSGKA